MKNLGALDNEIDKNKGKIQGFNLNEAMLNQKQF
jgi:hypothetical protein